MGRVKALVGWRVASSNGLRDKATRFGCVRLPSGAGEPRIVIACEDASQLEGEECNAWGNRDKSPVC